MERIGEALREIQLVARVDPSLAAEGAVVFLEKLSAALSDVDSSSGSLGNATWSAVEELTPLIAQAPVTDKVRRKWLDRLFDALQDDDPPYIENLGDHWGSLCASPALASEWADQLLPSVRNVLSSRSNGVFGFFTGTGACYSALFAANRHDELLAVALAEDDGAEEVVTVFGHRVARVAGAVPLQELVGQLNDGMSTRSIYKKAFKLLKRLHRPSAARYTLKQAIFDFGNTGFPFEDFFAEILKRQGYQVQTRQLLPGACIQHEVDVVARNEKVLILVECKYHPLAGSVSNVKIPLYIHSRFRDLEQNRAFFKNEHDNRQMQGWIVTNSRFSDDAMSYGRCAGLHLISWNYPSGGSLRELVDRAGLYPITCLTTLSRYEKTQLLANSIVLCQSLMNPGDWSELLHLSNQRCTAIMQEAQVLCALAM